MRKYIPASVISVDPPKPIYDGLGYKKGMSAEVVVVVDETGEHYDFVTGSLNGLQPEMKTVGTKGFIFIDSTASYSLPRFLNKKGRN